MGDSVGAGPGDAGAVHDRDSPGSRGPVGSGRVGGGEMRPCCKYVEAKSA